MLLTVGLGAGACNATTTPDRVQRGGTLLVIVPTEGTAIPALSNATFDLDSGSANLDAEELARCCLARTLMSYMGEPTRDGGAELRPDVATGPPDVSADGLTWTFHLRAGLHYAPPLQSTEITSGDFVRSLQRYARVGQPNGNTLFFQAIEGYNAYALGQTGAIQGLETPDAHTLVVRLTEPQGDLAYRLSIPAIAPLPPLPGGPSEPYGVATGHDADWGGFIVASGPYMLEGAGMIDFLLPVTEQHPASGLIPGISVTLVRNPSWSSATDSLRPAYADRIVLTYGGSINDALAAVDTGKQDLVLTEAPSPQVPAAEVHAWEAQPSRGAVDIEPRNFIRYISMNLAEPPFDDVHVRRAVNYVLDKNSLVSAAGGATAGTVTGHIALDDMEDDALLMYNPYAGTDATRVSLARQEMAQSPYDMRHTGSCEAVVCQHIPALALAVPTAAALAGVVQGDLAQIGIHLDVTTLKGNDFFARLGSPTADPAMALFWAWGQDYPNASDFFAPQYLSSQAIPGGVDSTLVGASPQQLRSWGYAVDSVPSVDARISACLPLVGDAQTQCWTVLDEYMVEKVAAVVPYISESYTELVPARLAHYSYDQSVGFPALDQVALAKH
jgi:peptide/nickel transport system substrate-binding protein